jgi:hypothetical protein
VDAEHAALVAGSVAGLEHEGLSIARGSAALTCRPDTYEESPWPSPRPSRWTASASRS